MKSRSKYEELEKGQEQERQFARTAPNPSFYSLVVPTLIPSLVPGSVGWMENGCETIRPRAGKNTTRARGWPILQATKAQRRGEKKKKKKIEQVQLHEAKDSILQVSVSLELSRQVSCFCRFLLLLTLRVSLSPWPVSLALPA